MDKLLDAVTFKLSPEHAMQVRRLAESQGMGVSEYVRSLIDQDLQRRHQQCADLATIFGYRLTSFKE